MTEFIGWRFLADSTEPSIKSGSAEFRVGPETAIARFESFADAHKVFGLIEKAYKSGVYDGKADIKHRVDAAVNES